MNIKYWNQPKSATLEKILNDKLKKGFKKVWIVGGMTKDSGIDIIFDSISLARKMGSEVNVMLGLDRKNTSKDMLMKLLNVGCNLFVHINRDDNKVETRMYVFENEDGESFVYSSGGKFSEGGLTSNYCMIQEIIYEKEDVKLFENFKSVFMQNVDDVFQKVDEEEIKLLAEKGEIVARITERKIPSISEMYGNSSIDAISNDVYDEGAGAKLFEIPENDDFEIDIDISFDGESQKVELSAETEAKREIMEKASIEKLAEEKLAKLFENKEENELIKKNVIVKDTNDIDFTNVKIFVFELNKIVEKGLGEGEIKIPLYLYENMTDFFGNDFRLLTDDKGKERLASSVKLNILDVETNDKFSDENSFMYDNGKSFSIKSNVLKSLCPKEGDILRLIKVSDGEFDAEFIKSGTKEYDIWSGFCKYTMKNSKRKFGVM